MVTVKVSRVLAGRVFKKNSNVVEFIEKIMSFDVLFFPHLPLALPRRQILVS